MTHFIAHDFDALQALAELTRLIKASRNHTMQQMHVFCNEHRAFQAHYATMLSGGLARSGGLQTSEAMVTR
jgi:hypothetical protein